MANTPEAGHGSAPGQPKDAKHPNGAGKEGGAGAKARDAAAAGFAAFKNLGAGLGAGIVSRVKGAATGLLRFPLLLFSGTLTTRLLMLGFLVSIGLLALTSLQLYRRFAPAGMHLVGKKIEMSSGLQKFFEAQQELTIAQANMLFLDKFGATLLAAGEKPRAFNVEMYVECSSPETSALLKARIDFIRETVSAALQGYPYDKAITEEGKSALKRKILDTLNKTLRDWKSSGRVKRVFFTSFIVG